MNKVILLFSGLPRCWNIYTRKIYCKSIWNSLSMYRCLLKGLKDLFTISVGGRGYWLAYCMASNNLQQDNNIVTDYWNLFTFPLFYWFFIFRHM